MILTDPNSSLIWTTYIIGNVVSKLLQNKAPKTQNLYAILIPY